MRNSLCCKRKTSVQRKFKLDREKVVQFSVTHATNKEHKVKISSSNWFCSTHRFPRDHLLLTSSPWNSGAPVWLKDDNIYELAFFGMIQFSLQGGRQSDSRSMIEITKYPKRENDEQRLHKHLLSIGWTIKHTSSFLSLDVKHVENSADRRNSFFSHWEEKERFRLEMFDCCRSLFDRRRKNDGCFFVSLCWLCSVKFFLDSRSNGSSSECFQVVPSFQSDV